MMEFNDSPRPSQIAGTWYTASPQQLASEIDAYLANARLSDDEFSGNLFGIVAPHAGHRYSGNTAGFAYKTVQGTQRDIVVILSPFHQYHSGDVLTSAYSNYVTPLGRVDIAVDLMNETAEILDREKIKVGQVNFDPEHSLEIQLPFLQRAIHGDFHLMPFMVRTWDRQQIQKIADAFMLVLKDRTFLVVASTDLSHFYPLETAQQLDAEMLRRIKALDAEGVLSAEREGVASACGAASVAALIYAAKHMPDARSYILNYSTSAAVTGDTRSVVGYGSAAIFI